MKTQAQEQETVAQRVSREKAEREAELQARMEPWRKANEVRQAEEKRIRQEEEQARRDRLQALQEAAFDRSYKLGAKLSYIRTGGSEAAFEEQWPDMRERMRAELAIKASERTPRRTIAF